MKARLIFIFLVAIFAACGGRAPATENDSLTVSAAVSLKDAFNELGALYKTRTGRAVSFNFGASGALQRQIENGAPVDVFASAGAVQMDELAAKKLIDPETRRDFARNTLVLVVPAGARSNLAAFSGLAGPDVSKIAVGNPKTVPAGQYTAEVFEKTGLKNALRDRLIVAEDVRQVLDYVIRGETDAGIVYLTDARSAGEKVRVAATAPDGSHAPIRYPLAILRDSRQKAAAQTFVDLVTSAEGRAVLKKYGFADPFEK